MDLQGCREKEILTLTLSKDYSKIEKDKLKNLLQSPYFCGLCLNYCTDVSSAHSRMEIIVDKQINIVMVYEIIEYVFKEPIENLLKSTQVCDTCIKNIIQSYLFMYNTRKVTQAVNKYLNELNSKFNDVDIKIDPLSKSSYDNCTVVAKTLVTDEPKYVIPREINVELSVLHIKNEPLDEESHDNFNENTFFENEERNVENTKTKKPNVKSKSLKYSVNKSGIKSNVKQRSIKQSQKKKPVLKNQNTKIKLIKHTRQTTRPTFSHHNCVKCKFFLLKYRKWREHEKTIHKPNLECKICNRKFNNKALLYCHYKMHSKIRCRVCQVILPDSELLEHLKLNHEDMIYPCKQCHLIYYSADVLETHEKISHLPPTDTNDTSQCIMCLKSFDEDNLKNHRCRFSCLECVEMPCVHHKYLISYRDQLLNHSTKVKCIDCGHYSRRKEILLGHVNREHLNHHPFMCDNCGQQFYSKATVRFHMKRFHLESYVCQFCDQDFKRDSKSYMNHKKACEVITRDIKCSKCVASFNTADELSMHDKRRHNEEIFACNQCNRKFFNAGKLKEHNVKVHAGLQIKNRMGDLSCMACNMKFDTKGELLYHKKTHSSDVKYPCKICNMEFETSKKLRQHSKRHDMVECMICKKRMQNSFLAQHMVRHGSVTEVPVFTCETCGKSYRFESALRLHQQSHSEAVPCPKCKILVKPDDMNKHLNKHKIEDERVISEKSEKCKTKCNWCDFTSYRPTVEVHMNKHHKKVAPHVCNICNAGFFGKQRLKDHVKTHKTEKDVVCGICNKSYANRVCLKMHMRIHTGEKNYACDICNERFFSSSIMNTHKIKKHAERTIPCPICGGMFYLVRDMRHHVKKVHWKNKDKPFDHREVPGLPEEFFHLFEDRRKT